MSVIIWLNRLVYGNGFYLSSKFQFKLKWADTSKVKLAKWEQRVLCVHRSNFSLQFFTSESCFIEDRFFATANQTWVSIHTSDEMMIIARNGVSWVWPETCWWWTWINFCWAFETNDSCNESKIFYMKYMLINETRIRRRETHPLGCKYATTDLANCSHEFVHHMPNHRHNGAVMVHRERISNKLWNILRYLDRYRRRIHILALKVGLL